MRTLFKVVAILSSAAILLIAFGYWLFQPSFGIDVSDHPFLPESAKNICYYRQFFGPFRTIECDISHDEFRKIFQRESWTLSPIDRPIRISRFIEAAQAFSEPLPPHYASASEKFIATTGEFYQSDIEPDGGHTTVYYDKSTGRAFFYFGAR
jgi:hypothetical protein